MYGTAKPCYVQWRWSDADLKSCDSLRVYDRIEVAANISAQEVNVVLTGLRLDDSNVVFRKIKSCVVVDVNNFACEGFVKKGGKITDSTAFGAKVSSTSYLAYLWSQYAGKAISKSSLSFLDSNDAWIKPVLIAFLVLALLGIAGEERR